jgi:hypothetical protein
MEKFMSEKKVFDFPVEGSLEGRRTDALEFIAHYLDRIDGHLEKIAAAAEGSDIARREIAAQIDGLNNLLARK